MLNTPSFLPPLLASATVAFFLLGACDANSQPENPQSVSADANVPDKMPDGGSVPLPDAGPCVPGPESLTCKNASTVSFCSEDTDFDGMSDGPAAIVEITCSAFFSNAGDASCEPFDATSSEALCTMDDGGPCGVILVSGGFTSARCTSDNAICLLDLEAQNYLCTPDSGIACGATGSDFVPFCQGDLLVWRCTDDGDNTPQAQVDDCAALGNGICDAEQNACTGIQRGGQCNLTEWLCADEFTCENNVCV